MPEKKYYNNNPQTKDTEIKITKTTLLKNKVTECMR